jgi:dienelactone hydrolase
MRGVPYKVRPTVCARVVGRPNLRVAFALLLAALGGCGGGGEHRNNAVGEALFGYDRNQPLDAHVAPLSQVSGEALKRVTYSDPDHDRVTALLATPQGEKRDPCVIYVPGFGGKKEDAQSVAVPLEVLGIGLLAIDGPHQGARAKSPTELEAVRRNPALLASTMRQTVIDVRRGLDFLATRPECDPHRLGFVGFSFGAITGTFAAASDARIRSVVLLSDGAGIKYWLTRPGIILTRREIGNPQIHASALKTLAPYFPEHWIGLIAPRPVLMVNGTEDGVIPISVAQTLQRAAGKNSAVMWYVGHHDPFSSQQLGPVLQRIQDFLRRTLVNGRSSG